MASDVTRFPCKYRATNQEYTLDSHYKSSESCAPFSRMSYGGIIAFNKVSDECELDKTNLSLHCNLTQSFTLPEGIPPGRARLFFK
jgi:hypothetical protein